MAEVVLWSPGGPHRKQQSTRPQLAAALTEARKRGALLVVAKLDHLARDVELISSLVKEAERNGCGGLLFADFPDVDPTTPEGELSIHQMGAFAQFEARRISQRTKEGLAVAKSRGVKLGGARGGQRAANEARQQQAVEFAERLRGILLQWQPVVRPCLPWHLPLRLLASIQPLARAPGRQCRSNALWTAWGCADCTVAGTRGPRPPGSPVGARRRKGQ